MAISQSLMNKNLYEREGYLLMENFFLPEEIQRANDAINEIIQCGDISKVAEVEPKDSSIVRRIWAPTKRHNFFEQMASSDKLLDVVETLIGSNIMFHYSKLNMKGPKLGSIVEWHQDFSYYPHTNTDLLSCLIYLDDATIANGCLEVIPQSHKHTIFDHCIDGNFRGKVTNVERITGEHNLPERVFLEAPAGSVIFLHCLTLHASAINKSDKPRRAFIPAYRSADSYPIYFGPHASHNESGVKLLRGKMSLVARVDSGRYALPSTAGDFNSLYELQEGRNLQKNGKKNSLGYYASVD